MSATMEHPLYVQFADITGATPQQAEVYLRFSDGNLEQAIQLYFESPDLASQATASTSTAAPPRPVAAITSKRTRYKADDEGVLHIDSDDAQDDDSDDVEVTHEQPAPGNDAASTDIDAEFARNLQEEMYWTGLDEDPDRVRAPIERTRETLVGGPEEMGDDEIASRISEFMRTRGTPRPNRKFGKLLNFMLN
jgi:hypothetical protein